MEQLNEIIFEIHRKLSGGKENLIIQYEPDIDDRRYDKKMSS